MGPARQRWERSFGAPLVVGLIVLIVALSAATYSPPAVAAEEEEWINPLLGDAQAIDDGARLFRQRCTGCHWNPRRGPRIFQTKRPYEKFLEIVINGKKSQRTMPRFGYILSPDDISKIHAYLMSRERP